MPLLRRGFAGAHTSPPLPSSPTAERPQPSGITVPPLVIRDWARRDPSPADVAPSARCPSSCARADRMAERLARHQREAALVRAMPTALLLHTCARARWSAEVYSVHPHARLPLCIHPVAVGRTP